MKCACNMINGCENEATVEVKDRRGRVLYHVCSEECGNEVALEDSNGTWCPFPNASNALTMEQLNENLSYFCEE